MDYKKLISRALERKFSDLEVYETTDASLSIAVFNGKVDKNEMSEVTKISIRAIYDGKMAYLGLENTEEDIEFILNNLEKNAKTLTTDEEFSIFAGSKEYPQIEKKDNDFRNYTNLDRIEMLQSLEKKIREKDARVVYVPYCNYEEASNKVRIVNSKGLDISKENSYCVVVAQVVAKEQEDVQSGFKVKVKLNYKDLNIDEIANEVVEKAVAMLNARPVPSKSYPTIIDKEAMTDLFSSFQSIFSGEAAIKKITPLLGKLGEQIMDAKITIVDDPLCKESISISPFDDEGVACYKKNVVEKGIFKTFLHNLKTAKYFHTESTGNGFKMGSTIGVSGSNLYIEKGNVSKEEMIASLEEGLLITDVEGLHAGVNPISGDFSLKASGFLITNGKINRAVTLIVISGNFFKLMKEVQNIANDLEIGYTGIASPSLQFKAIAVSGE